MQRNCDIANSNKFQIKFLTYSNKQVTQFSMQWLCDKFFLPNAIRLASLVVAVISVEAYPFFGFLRPDLSPSGYWNKCFLVALCRLIVRKPNLEVATKRLLYHQVKIPGQFQYHVREWKCIPTAISSSVDISEVPGCHLLRPMSSQ